MPEHVSRVRLQLAAELQAARRLAGINQRDLAATVGISQSYVARVERAERLLSRPRVTTWLRATKTSPEVRDRVLALTEAAHTETAPWSELFAAQNHLQHQARERNATARLVQDYSPTVLPGLTQTADYARAVIPLADVTGEVDHAAALAARIERQGVLHDGAEREFEFLIAQRLLTWAPAPGVLGPQLAQLLAVAALPHVRLAVLPDRYAGALPWHNFVLRQPADGSPAYVAAELIDGDHLVREPDSVATYVRLWTRMWAAAVRDVEALALIRAAAGQ